jgi:hypothetical protein
MLLLSTLEPLLNLFKLLWTLEGKLCNKIRCIERSKLIPLFAYVLALIWSFQLLPAQEIIVHNSNFLTPASPAHSPTLVFP